MISVLNLNTEILATKKAEENTMYKTLYTKGSRGKHYVKNTTYKNMAL